MWLKSEWRGLQDSFRTIDWSRISAELEYRLPDLEPIFNLG